MQHDNTVFEQNETMRTIKARRSVRSYAKDEVTDGQVKALL